MISDEFKDRLEPTIYSRKRILFLGIGENRMSDDGFGQYVSFNMIQLMRGIETKSLIKIINGKTDYVERKSEILAFRPNLLILIDTCQPNDDTSTKPGRLYLHKEDMFTNWLPLSSHVLPIPVFLTELKFSLPNLETILIGIVPISTDFVDDVNQYKSDKYTLDDYENNSDLPFYDFNLTPKIQKTADELIVYLLEILKI